MGAFKSVWNFLNGKKTVIMTVLMAAELATKGTKFEGPLTAVSNVTKMIGWDAVAPAIDPAKLVVLGGVAVALGHKAIKALNTDPR